MRFLADLHSAPLSFVLFFFLAVAGIAVPFLGIPWPRISRAVGAFLGIGAVEILCAHFVASFWFYRVALPLGILLWLVCVLTLWLRGDGGPEVPVGPGEPTPPSYSTVTLGRGRTRIRRSRIRRGTYTADDAETDIKESDV